MMKLNPNMDFGGIKDPLNLSVGHVIHAENYGGRWVIRGEIWGDKTLTDLRIGIEVVQDVQKVYSTVLESLVEYVLGQLLPERSALQNYFY